MTIHGMADHLTEPNPEQAAREKATPPGMAHWAGTGPPNMACGHCAFFAGRQQRIPGVMTEVDGVKKWTRGRYGDIQPGRCRKYVSMMRGAWRAVRVPIHKLPPETPACSHFKVKPLRALAKIAGKMQALLGG